MSSDKPKKQLMRVALLPDGERYICIRDLRSWLDNPLNLAKVSALAAKGILRGACPMTILRKMLIFPVWETEQVMDREMEERRAKAHLN